jgi:putative membrane protein
MPYWHGGGWGFGFWWTVPIFFGIAWLALFGLIIWRMRGLGPCRRGWGPDPLDVLRDRFARGEIDAEEYERRRHVLEAR